MIVGSAPARTGRPSSSTDARPPPPSIGMKFDAVADWTPGIASTRRTMSSTRCRFASSDSYRSPGM
jgi:hypothetical protein